MEWIVRVIFLIFIFGSLLLNSCHPVSTSKSLLKPISKRIDGLQLKTLGPNCWNGALIKTGIAHSVRFVSKGEYWFWMNSSYCRKLEKNEKPKKGDLGSLFWGERGHYHSFVYLDDRWVFSKNSPDPKFKYEVQAFEDMFHFQFKNKARKCWKEFHGSLKLECEFQVQFHQCKPTEDDFFRSDSKLIKWDTQIIPLEERVFNWVTKVKKLKIEEFEKSIEQLNGILGEVQKEIKLEITSARKFKLEALEFRLIGLILSDIKIASTSKKLNPLLNEIYKLQSSKSPQFVLRESIVSSQN